MVVVPHNVFDKDQHNCAQSDCPIDFEIRHEMKENLAIMKDGVLGIAAKNNIHH